MDTSNTWIKGNTVELGYHGMCFILAQLRIILVLELEVENFEEKTTTIMRLI